MFSRRYIYAFLLVSGALLIAAIIWWPPSESPSTASLAAAQAEVPQDNPEELLSGVIEGRKTLYTVTKSNITKHSISEFNGYYKWEGRLSAISPQYAQHGFKLGDMGERGTLSADGTVLDLEIAGYSPNCGTIWYPGWKYRIASATYDGRKVWTFEQIGRACAAPHVDNYSCRVTHCVQWSDGPAMGEKFSYLVKDFDLAKEIFATRPGYDPSWITDTWN